MKCDYCNPCTYNDDSMYPCTKKDRIDYEYSVEEAFVGHDIEVHPHGFLINSKLIVGKQKFRFKGKSKWYWYNGDMNNLLKYLMN